VTGGAATGGTAGGGPTGSGGSGSGGDTWGIWVNAYYPGWTQGRLRPQDLDFSAVTQIIHFAFVPTASGGLDDALNGVDAAQSKAIIDAAHAAGKKVLIAVGGSGRGSEFFGQAISDANRATFIENLLNETLERGYDGIDIDMEPIRGTNVALFQQFSRELRDRIQAAAPHLLLTCAALGASSSVFGPVGDVYDQVNIMTYDLVYGPRSTWHNSPLSGGAGEFYSADRAAREYAAAGVPKSKIGIGIDFSGYVYSGATDPKQPYTNRSGRTSYTQIMSEHFSEQAYRWDEEAQAPYLSISDQQMFVTYENEELILRKIDFVRTEEYGGVIIWEPSAGYYPNNPDGQKHPLLQAVKDAVTGVSSLR
jgi:chitinase